MISIHALLAESDFNGFEFPLCAVHFYPRSPCGERLISDAPSSAPYAISIHALLAESDLCAFVSLFGVFLFLSTLSLRRATISSLKVIFAEPNFYPRSPCGERRLGLTTRMSFCKFLSTLSLRRATRFSVFNLLDLSFLSTLSLRRATPMISEIDWLIIVFLSTLSLRRATGDNKKIKVVRIFLSTLSLRRATRLL